MQNSYILSQSSHSSSDFSGSTITVDAPIDSTNSFLFSVISLKIALIGNKYDDDIFFSIGELFALIDDLCDYFEDKGKIIASTLSLTVLVTIEMFNALNALSEECSLLVVPPHKNMYLVAAIVASFIAHFCILYIPPLASIFSVSPLTWREWKLVLWFSFPVIVIDEVLKLVGRLMDKKQRQNHVAEAVPLLSIQ